MLAICQVNGLERSMLAAIKPMILLCHCRINRSRSWKSFESRLAGAGCLSTSEFAVPAANTLSVAIETSGNVPHEGQAPNDSDSVDFDAAVTD